MKKLVIAWDCSGSMSESEMQKALDYIKTNFPKGNEEIFNLCFDTQVQMIERTGTDRCLPSKLVGRGGTDYSCLFDNVNPAIPMTTEDTLFIITDGFGACPTKEPYVKVHWLLLDTVPNQCLPCFGKVSLIS